MTKPVVPSLQVSGKVDCLTFQLPSSFLSFLEKKKKKKKKLWNGKDIAKISMV